MSQFQYLASGPVSQKSPIVLCYLIIISCIFSQPVPRGYRLGHSQNYLSLCLFLFLFLCFPFCLPLSPHPPKVLSVQRRDHFGPK